MKTNFFRILPLVLCVPSLMALTPEEANSNTGYEDFTVKIKAITDSPKPDLYEFTIYNYGDCYLDKQYIYQDFTNSHYLEPFGSRDCVQENFRTLIKPKETCVLRSYVNTSYWNIKEGEFNDFKGTGYSVRNDVINTAGPYNFSISNQGKEKLLKIDCEITQLQQLNTNRAYYYYFYAINMNYNGEDFCIVSEYQNDLDGIETRFSNYEEIDPSKLTISNIDSFIMVDFAECCEPVGIRIFKLALVVLAGLGAFGIVFGTIIVVVKRIDKKS